MAEQSHTIALPANPETTLKINHFQANALTLNFTTSAAYTEIILELRKPNVDGESGRLDSLSLTSQTAGAKSMTFTGAQMNRPVDGERQVYRLWLAAKVSTEHVTLARIDLVLHADETLASATSPPPDPVELYLTQSQAAAIYAEKDGGTFDNGQIGASDFDAGNVENSDIVSCDVIDSQLINCSHRNSPTGGIIVFDAGGIPDGQTRTLTAPNASGTIALDGRAKTAAEVGLTYFWDAAGYSAGTWTNSIGGVNFVQSDAAKRPATGNNINGLASLTFDGTNDFLPTASNLTILNDCVIFAVWKPNHAGSVNGYFTAEHGAAIASNDGISLTATNYGGQLRRTNTLTVAGTNMQYVESYQTGSVFICVWEIKNWQWSQYINGVPVLGQSVTYPVATSMGAASTAALFYLGAKTAGTTLFANGHLGDFGIKSGTMTRENIEAFSRTLAVKYGVTL